MTVDRSLLDALGPAGRRRGRDGRDRAVPRRARRLDPDAGSRVRATGTVGRAWGAPRLRVEADPRRSAGGRRSSTTSSVAPGAATEWRLVRVRGTIADVHRSGDRWTAELVGRRRCGSRCSGCPGSGIPAAAVIEGRRGDRHGDRQAAVSRRRRTSASRCVPRSRADLVLGGRRRPRPPARAPRAAGASAARRHEPGARRPPATRHRRPRMRRTSRSPSLGDRLGGTVRVGGLVTAVDAGGIRLDDGTATARVVLEGAAADLASLLQPGDALNATGTPRPATRSCSS